MPIYFFDLFNGSVTEDLEGIDLASDDAARTHAVKEAREMAAVSVRHGQLTGTHRIDYLDKNRTTIGTVRFDEAVHIKP